MDIRKVGGGPILQGPDDTKVGPGTPYPDYEVVPPQDPFSGGVSGYIAGNVKRNPQNVITSAASATPMGRIGAIGRPLLAGGGTLAATQDPMKAAEAFIDSLTGEALGGIVGAGTRTIKSAADKTIKGLTQLITKEIPEFRAETPAGVFNRIIGGEGMREVSRKYGEVRKRLWEKHLGTPYPEGSPTSSVGGSEVPFSELYDKLSTGWPQAAKDELAAIKQKYFQAKTVEEWIRTTPLTKLLPGTGKVEVAPLQQSMLSRRAKLKDALPGVEGAMRMEPESAARDIPAQGLLQSIGGHASPGGFWAYLKGLPHAAKMAGENVTPEMASQVARSLGSTGASDVTGKMTRPKEQVPFQWPWERAKEFWSGEALKEK